MDGAPVGLACCAVLLLLLASGVTWCAAKGTRWAVWAAWRQASYLLRSITAAGGPGRVLHGGVCVAGEWLLIATTLALTIAAAPGLAAAACVLSRAASCWTARRARRRARRRATALRRAEMRLAARIRLHLLVGCSSAFASAAAERRATRPHRALLRRPSLRYCTARARTAAAKRTRKLTTSVAARVIVAVMCAALIAVAVFSAAPRPAAPHAALTANLRLAAAVRRLLGARLLGLAARGASAAAVCSGVWHAWAARLRQARKRDPAAAEPATRAQEAPAGLRSSPDADTLRARAARDGSALAAVRGFAVWTRLGRVDFQKPVDLRGVASLADVFEFAPGRVHVHGGGETGGGGRAAPRHGCDRPARVTLRLPASVLDALRLKTRRAGGRGAADVCAELRARLQAVCTRQGSKLVDVAMPHRDAAVWTFDVAHFSGYGIDDDALAAGDAPPAMGAAAEDPAAPAVPAAPAASCSTPGDDGGKRARAELAAGGNCLRTSPLKPAAPPQPRPAADPPAARASQLRCITNALAARAQPGSSRASKGGASSKASVPTLAGVRKLTSLWASAASATSSAGPSSQPAAAAPPPAPASPPAAADEAVLFARAAELTSAALAAQGTSFLPAAAALQCESDEAVRAATAGLVQGVLRAVLPLNALRWFLRRSDPATSMAAPPAFQCVQPGPHQWPAELRQLPGGGMLHELHEHTLYVRVVRVKPWALRMLADAMRRDLAVLGADEHPAYARVVQSLLAAADRLTPGDAPPCLAYVGVHRGGVVSARARRHDAVHRNPALGSSLLQRTMLRELRANTRMQHGRPEFHALASSRMTRLQASAAEAALAAALQSSSFNMIAGGFVRHPNVAALMPLLRSVQELPLPEAPALMSPAAADPAPAAQPAAAVPPAAVQPAAAPPLLTAHAPPPHAAQAGHFDANHASDLKADAIALKLEQASQRLQWSGTYLQAVRDQVVPAVRAGARVLMLLDEPSLEALRDGTHFEWCPSGFAAGYMRQLAGCKVVYLNLSHNPALRSCPQHTASSCALARDIIAVLKPALVVTHSLRAWRAAQHSFVLPTTGMGRSGPHIADLSGLTCIATGGDHEVPVVAAPDLGHAKHAGGCPAEVDAYSLVLLVLVAAARLGNSAITAAGMLEMVRRVQAVPAYADAMSRARAHMREWLDRMPRSEVWVKSADAQEHARALGKAQVQGRTAQLGLAPDPQAPGYGAWLAVTAAKVLRLFPDRDAIKGVVPKLRGLKAGVNVGQAVVAMLPWLSRTPEETEAAMAPVRAGFARARRDTRAILWNANQSASQKVVQPAAQTARRGRETLEKLLVELRRDAHPRMAVLVLRHHSPSCKRIPDMPEGVEGPREPPPCGFHVLTVTDAPTPSLRDLLQPRKWDFGVCKACSTALAAQQQQDQQQQQRTPALRLTVLDVALSPQDLLPWLPEGAQEWVPEGSQAVSSADNSVVPLYTQLLAAYREALATNGQQPEAPVLRKRVLRALTQDMTRWKINGVSVPRLLVVPSLADEYAVSVQGLGLRAMVARPG